MSTRSFGSYVWHSAISLFLTSFAAYVLLANDPDTDATIGAGALGLLSLFMFVSNVVLALRTRPHYNAATNDSFALTVMAVGQMFFWPLLVIQTQNDGVLRIVLAASAAVCFIASIVGFSMHRWVYGPRANIDHPLGKIRLGEPKQDFNGSGLATGVLTARHPGNGSIARQ